MLLYDREMSSAHIADTVYLVSRWEVILFSLLLLLGQPARMKGPSFDLLRSIHEDSHGHEACD